MLKPVVPAQNVEEIDRNTIYAKVRLRVAPFLVLLYIAAFLDRVNISFASLTMNRDLKISENLFGFGAGIFFIGYLLFAIPSNILLLRLGVRRWIATIMIAWGLLSAAMAFVHGAPLYILLRFMLGVAEAGFFPGIILYLTLWLPSKARASLMALFVLSIPVSTVIGAPLSNWILSLGGVEGLRGWQWLFLLEGLPAILLGCLVPFLLAEGPDQVGWLTQQEKRSLRSALEEDQTASTGEGVAWQALLRKPAVFGFAFQYFTLMIGLYALSFWVPRILSSRGVSSAHLGWFTAIPFALGGFGMVFCSWSSDRVQERKWHIVSSFACAAVGMGIAAPPGRWLFAMVGLGFAAIGTFSAMPIFWAAVVQGMDTRLAALAIAFVNSLGNVGGFVGPLMIGTILQHTGSYSDGLLFTAACLLLGAVVLALTPVKAAAV